jgi:hypothetical protein
LRTVGLKRSQGSSVTKENFLRRCVNLL